MADTSETVQVVFRNQARAPVTVIINGLDSTGGGHQVYSGTVQGLSGVFYVSGYASYSCSAYASKMDTPFIAADTDVTIVFDQHTGAQT